MLFLSMGPHDAYISFLFHQIALHVSKELHSTPPPVCSPQSPIFHLLLWLGPEPSHLAQHFLLKNNLPFVFSFKVFYPGWNTRPLGKYKIITSLLHTLLLLVESRNQNNGLLLVDKKWTCTNVSSLLAKHPICCMHLFAKLLSKCQGCCLSPHLQLCS